MFDLRIIRSLIKQGHRVVLALKEGFYFDSPTFWDWERDPALAEALEEGYLFANPRASKNELLQAQREHPLLVISDGTREEMNLYRTSVTFARAWKEADLIMAKGEPHHRRLIATDQEFTRDVLCFHRDADGVFHMHHKPRAAHVVKFSELHLKGKADEIIAEMRQAKAEGRTVMFYSAIIGSIPGQTGTAIKVVDAFVRHLRTKLEGTYIINPAEHFEEGMDADDLMFMWERVQRSGLLGVWRFQTVTDIERSFELMGRKIPPVWAGKDSTYSTGCTKEMRIALDMQSRNPEMQLIGPQSGQVLPPQRIRCRALQRRGVELASSAPLFVKRKAPRARRGGLYCIDASANAPPYTGETTSVKGYGPSKAWPRPGRSAKCVTSSGRRFSREL